MASSTSNATPDARRQTFIPAAALKRFANQLESEGTNNKFLQINRSRVNEFLDKAPEISHAHKAAKQEARSKLKIAGVHEYPEKPIAPTFLSLQNAAEFQHSLGDRSRFGQGDGSFFDQWLNSDVIKSKHVLDKDGLPLMKFSLSQQSGFKKHLADYKADYKKPEGAVQYIKPYTQRREERLKEEGASSSTTTTAAAAVESLPKPVAPDNSRPVTRTSVSTTASTSLHLPPISNIQLTATDRENYFGDQARQTFFDYYRQLARQRYTVGEIDDQEAIDRIRYNRETETENLDELSRGGTTRGSEGGQYYLEGTEEGEEGGELSLGLTGSYAKKPSALAGQMDDYHNESDAAGGGAGGSYHLAAMEKSQPHVYYALHGTENAKHREEERQLLLAHLAPPLGTRPSTATSVGPNSPRPFSARSKFLLNCVKRDIIPQPSIIIRKEVSSTLNIQSMGIGNELAELLSESLDTLPLLEGLVIGDNKLNDSGLVPIVNRLFKCVNLKSFDLSNNKVDGLTADALRRYISSPQCNLKQLIMSHADVDDNEASRFMSAIAVRNTIQELDLSQNILGSHEHALHKDEITAAEAIGRVLADPNCSLRKLNVAWNMIRYNSGVFMMRSLTANKTLTYLDISYNALGADGGEALGDALHFNTALVHLNISHNNISARAAFTIISGVRSCKTIAELDISENPIGERGARALLGLNMHEGHRLTVNIKGCSLKVSDPKCWFDSNHIEKEFTLHLSQPYDRAVCFDLLRIVSQMDGWTVGKYLYQGPEESTATELHLGVFSVKEAPPDAITKDLKSVGLTDRSNQDEEEDVFEDVSAARLLFRKAASKVFRQVDHDENGTLDKNELLDVLFQMGIKSSQGMADKLLSIYDTDGSGRIEEDEFVQFIEDINQSVERVAKDHSERRYMYANPNSVEYNEKSAPPAEYFPPDKGKVVVKIAGSKTVSEFVQTISKQSVQTMLEATKGLSDSGALFECALSVMKLEFNEAKTFYRVLVKDSGSEQSALVRLLPNMASPVQARLMIAFATGNDFVKLHHVRAFLGQSYRIFIGLPNGFYRLNLSDDRDRYCLERLMELSNTHKLHREKHKLEDTSQNGDYHGFRNVLMDGHPYVFTDWFFDSVPTKGRVEFDFVCLEHVSEHEPTISNFRLYRLMSGLGMIEEENRKRAFARMKFQYAEGREASKGSGVKKWETSNKIANDVNAVLRRVYVEYASGHRPAFDDVIHIEKEEMMFIERSKEGVKHIGEALDTVTSASATAANEISRAISTSKDGAKEDAEAEYMSPAVGNTPKVTPKHLTSTVSNADMMKEVGHDHHDHDPSLDHFDTHVKLMVQNEMVSPYTIAVRTLTMLDTALAGRYLTCAQLAMLLDKFPSLSSKSTQSDFISPKVELVVRLHSKLVDLINFDYVLKELVPHEYAMVVFRLGWLNIWNPMKPEGAIFLDLSRREDKQVVRMLLTLNFSEGPLHSWMEPYFRPAGTTELPDEIFKINSSWFTENTLPSSGTLSLTYYSGKGAGLLDCNPVVQCRLALMSLVLAHPYEEDLPIMFGQPTRMTLESAEEYLSQIGCELSFDTKIQMLRKQISPKARPGDRSPRSGFGGSRQSSPRSPRPNPAATAAPTAAVAATAVVASTSPPTVAEEKEGGGGEEESKTARTADSKDNK